MQGGRILIVDDQPQIGRMMLRALDGGGLSANFCDSPHDALRYLEREPVDVVISDVRMPEIDGIEFLRRAKSSRPSCDVILMTAYASVECARAALKEGAADFITKPFSVQSEMIPLIHQLLDAGRNNPLDLTPRIRLSPTSGAQSAWSGVVGRGPAMTRMLRRVQKVAASRSTVLLEGESGSGKEVVANLIHELSDRSKRPLVKVNCAALPESLLESELFGYKKGAFTGADRDREGLFQAADGGTLMLDEIGEISATFQPKLLRVLQEGEFHRLGDPGRARRVDVRVIASTNRNLEEAVEQGTFRRDLYYRLKVVPVDVPPLRAHREDLEELVAHFLQGIGQQHKIEVDPSAMDAMRSYSWPGNVRELQNALEYAAMFGNGRVVTAEDLPAGVHGVDLVGEGGHAIAEVNETLESLERRCILRALAHSNGNRTLAAKSLGITRRALGYRIEKYQLAKGAGVDLRVVDPERSCGSGEFAPVRAPGVIDIGTHN